MIKLQVLQDQNCIALGKRNYNIHRTENSTKGKFKIQCKVTQRVIFWLKNLKRHFILENISFGIGYHRLSHINYVVKS